MTAHTEEMVLVIGKKGYGKDLLGATTASRYCPGCRSVGTGAIKHVDQRIAQLEQAQKALAPQDAKRYMGDVQRMLNSDSRAWLNARRVYATG